MLHSFEDELTEEIYHGIHNHAIRKRIPPAIVMEAERKLDILSCAPSLESLKCIPSIGYDGPVRDAKGKYSIPLFDSWRIAFRWNEGPEDVELKS